MISLVFAQVILEVPNLTIPFLCIHGADDQLCLPSGSEFIYRNAGETYCIGSGVGLFGFVWFCSPVVVV